MVRLKITPDTKALSTTTPRTNPIKPYEEIAEGMETSFTSHLLKEMRDTIPKESPDSSAMEYYNSLMDYERAQLMAKSDTGLGVKKVILDQIVPTHMKHYLKNSHPENRQGMTVSTKENTHE
jgi:Rod binding domain-containing protein